MKAFVIAGTIFVLAGCADMGMHYGTSGGGAGGTSAHSPAGNSYDQQEEIFHSWIS